MVVWMAQEGADVEVALVPLVVASNGSEWWLGSSTQRALTWKSLTDVVCSFLTDSSLPVVSSSSRDCDFRDCCFVVCLTDRKAVCVSDQLS